MNTSTLVDIADLITIEEACAIGKVSVRTMKRLVAQGRAPQPVRFNRATLYRQSEVREWAKKYRLWYGLESGKWVGSTG